MYIFIELSSTNIEKWNIILLGSCMVLDWALRHTRRFSSLLKVSTIFTNTKYKRRKGLFTMSNTLLLIEKEERKAIVFNCLVKKKILFTCSSYGEDGKREVNNGGWGLWKSQGKRQFYVYIKLTKENLLPSPVCMHSPFVTTHALASFHKQRFHLIFRKTTQQTPKLEEDST